MSVDGEKQTGEQRVPDAAPAPAPAASEGTWLAPVMSIPGSQDLGDSGEYQVVSRDRMSHLHIVSAHHFAESALALEAGEAAEAGDASHDEELQHRAHVTAAVLAAAAFLEASINELYLELQKLSQSGQPQLRRELAMLPRVWPQIVGAPVLHKYQLALSVADGDQYNESRPPFVDADSLIHLRDALLSYRPDWEDRRGKHRTLQKRLQTKFVPNGLASADAPWFPDKCLGAGCAKWAVRSVELFSDDFCHRMAIPARPLIGREGAA